MKNLISIIALVSLVMAAGCNSDKEPDKWEYKIINFLGTTPFPGATSQELHLMNEAFPCKYENADILDSLNRAGKQGWELVDIIPVTETSYPNFGQENFNTGIRTNTKTGELKLVLKRRVADSPEKGKAGREG